MTSWWAWRHFVTRASSATGLAFSARCSLHVPHCGNHTKSNPCVNSTKERHLRQEWNAEGTFLSNCNHTGFICSLLQIISETASPILRPNGFRPILDSYCAILSLSHRPRSYPDFFWTCSLGSSGQCFFPKKEGPLVRYSVAHTEVHILGCPSRQDGGLPHGQLHCLMTSGDYTSFQPWNWPILLPSQSSYFLLLLCRVCSFLLPGTHLSLNVPVVLPIHTSSSRDEKRSYLPSTFLCFFCGLK